MRTGSINTGPALSVQGKLHRYGKSEGPIRDDIRNQLQNDIENDRFSPKEDRKKPPGRGRPGVKVWLPDFL